MDAPLRNSSFIYLVVARIFIYQPCIYFALRTPLILRISILLLAATAKWSLVLGENVDSTIVTQKTPMIRY